MEFLNFSCPIVFYIIFMAIYLRKIDGSKVDWTKNPFAIFRTFCVMVKLYYFKTKITKTMYFVKIQLFVS